MEIYVFRYFFLRNTTILNVIIFCRSNYQITVNARIFWTRMHLILKASQNICAFTIEKHFWMQILKKYYFIFPFLILVCNFCNFELIFKYLFLSLFIYLFIFIKRDSNFILFWTPNTSRITLHNMTLNVLYLFYIFLMGPFKVEFQQKGWLLYSARRKNSLKDAILCFFKD